MPNTNDGPAGDVTDTVPPAPTDEAPKSAFSGMVLGWGDPAQAGGEPEGAKAVETSAVDEAPKADAVKATTPPAKVEEKPAAATTVNFDGFSDASKTFWENALKAGHATPADVDRARTESQFAKFQPIWSKRNEEIAAQRKALEADAAKLSTRKDDIALLDKIRASEKELERWDRMHKEEPATEESAGGDLVDESKAAKIARETYAAAEAAKASRATAERQEFVKREGALRETVEELKATLSVSGETMTAYLVEEAKSFPPGVDPVEYAIRNLSPSDLQERLTRRHERTSLEAKLADLQSQLSQRASKQVQKSKQSLAPSPRVADAPLTGMSKVLAELGVADLSDVPGFGWPVNGESR